MPQPGEGSLPQPSAEDSFLDLLVETLAGLEESVRGQFLRQFFHNIAQIELTAAQSVESWEQVLQRHRELTDRLGRAVSLKTAIVDVLSSAKYLRVPILMEYDDFKKLRINAATDALTGLYNRRLFDEYCDKELNRANRYGQHLAVVILDLHKLKEVNDRHGHLQGDLVLRLAAATLRKTLRASDFAFRIGGDEFALLLPQTDTEQATTLCRRVRSQYENELQPLKLDVGVTLDFGVAVHPQDGDQKSELIKLADKKLYELKQAGRTNSRVAPLEPQAPREVPSPSIPRTGVTPSIPRAVVTPQVPVHPPATSAPTPIAASAPMVGPYAVERKWERLSLAGTKAHAVLTETRQKTAKVIDLSYGGVALEFDEAENLPNQFNAVLHVPILPPVRVALRKAYVLQSASGVARIGCSFVA
jgi:diguanylate cyclase (GGDEF)-like protein